MKGPVALLISSPNDGGVFALYNGNVYKLDHKSTTGLCVTETHIVQCEQPASLLAIGLSSMTPAVTVNNIEDIHDVLVHKESLFLAGTYENEIVQVSLTDGAEVQRWVFPGEHDSLHVNCIARHGEDIYFCAFGDFAETRGYKGNSLGAGFIQNLITGVRLVDGLSQPHSIIFTLETVLLANSEKKEIVEYDMKGQEVRKKQLGGYTRGMCIYANRLYVGLSCSRNIQETGVSTATILELDVATWEEQSRVELPVREIFSIQAISDEAHLMRIILAYAHKSPVNENPDMEVKDILMAASGIVFPKIFSDVERLRSELTNSHIQVENIRKELAILTAELSASVADNMLYQAELERKKKSVTVLQATCNERERELNMIYSSLSWKITRPIRRLLSFFQKTSNARKVA